MTVRLAALPLLVLALSPAAAQGAEKKFPKGFQWGSAISGFQAEPGGSPTHVDKRTDWYRWVTDSKNIADGIVSGDRPEDGPGHWQMYERDLDLARKRLNGRVFRTSIEWSRIFPRSTRGINVGKQVSLKELKRLDKLANKSALRHYRQVLAAARTRGLKPFITLSHFSLPSWIHDPIAIRDAFEGRPADDPIPEGLERAGWLDPDTADELGKYAAYIAWKFGDWVDIWNPINEPLVVTINGYVNIRPVLAGNFPPGVASFPGTLQVIQNLLVGNRRAYDEIHRWDRKAQVGLVQNMIGFTPADPTSEKDVLATGNANYIFHRLFLNAAVDGLFDDDADAIVDPGEERPAFADKADFIGVNYYFRGRVQGLDQPLTPHVPVSNFLPTFGYRWELNPTAAECPTECSDFGNEIYPEGLRDVLEIAGDYDRPVWITENGIADENDSERSEFLIDHLRVVRQAIADDVADVRGFLHWSLTDNFEWSVGYHTHFGLFSYNPETLARKARPSAALYARISKRNAVP
jgi:beta-glucosidase/6-phospho-beta-glucosidase/beta-galactosidase